MAEVLDKIYQVLKLNWLTGPIFDKELRIASRRKRYYFLRVGFIIVLLVLLLQSWFITMSFTLMSGPAAFRAARMSVVARGVTVTIAWLEFILLPLLGAVMMSNSISEEINKRTLDVLLTTPITNVQLIAGKILSRMLQLVILACITLPLLSVIRSFGGVPWDFVITSFCITMTTTFLYAGTSLFYSIKGKYAYRVVGRVVFTAMFFFILLPLGLYGLDHFRNWPWLGGVIEFLMTCNPYIGMSEITKSVMSSNPAGVNAFPWVRHSITISAAFITIILLSVIRLRKTVMNISEGGNKGIFAVRKLWGSAAAGKNEYVSARGLIEVKGDPIIWKEMRRRGSSSVVEERIANVLFIIIIVITYFLAAYYKVLMNSIFHAFLVTILTALAFLRTASLAALSISSEKQARTWPMLLTTPIEDRNIVRMKLKAIIKKTAHLWILIFGDVILFSLLLVLSPLAIIGVGAAVVPTVLFLIGLGLYFGMRLKTTTATMVVTFLTPMLLWFFCPCIMNFSPLALTAMSVGMGMQNGLGIMDSLFLFLLIIPACVYAVIGVVLISLTQSSMRKYVFNVP
jgi:ABC-type transport system involved in multi-copper enzyme maturation permease subunit